MSSQQNILKTIAEHNRALVREAEEHLSREELRARAFACHISTERPFEQVVARAGLSFICEVKRASPSKGLIAPEFDHLAIARSYEEARADAISCLTEPKWFMGSLDYLADIARELVTPVMRKDFVVDSYQIFEAKVAGASAVLLLCGVLDDEQLADYIELCDDLGMSALVEAYDEEELNRAVAVGARIIGVNNRNLRDFSVDFENAQRMRELIPDDRLYVAESGVSSLADVTTIAHMGADAALVGEFLMRADDKVALLAQMREASHA